MISSSSTCFLGLFCLSMVDYASYHEYKLQMQTDTLLQRNQINTHMLTYVDAYKTYALRNKVEFELMTEVYEELFDVLYAVEEAARHNHKDPKRCLQVTEQNVNRLAESHMNFLAHCLIDLRTVYQGLTENIERSNQTSLHLKEEIHLYLRRCEAEKDRIACSRQKVADLTSRVDIVETDVRTYHLTLNDAVATAEEALQCVKRERSKLHEALQPAKEDGLICAGNAE